MSHVLCLARGRPTAHPLLPAAGAGPGLLAADAGGGQRLLAQALRLAGEGKAAQLREQALALARAAAAAGGLWAALGAEERAGVLRDLRGIAERERLPALQAQAGALLAQLEGGGGGSGAAP